MTGQMWPMIRVALFGVSLTAAACSLAALPVDRDLVAKSASAAIEASCGRPVPVTIDWGSFEGGNPAAEAALNASGLEFLTSVLRDI